MPLEPNSSQEDAASVSRRDFLRVGSLSVVGLSMAERGESAGARPSSGPQSCIFLLMTGGASQLETFDPKPDAPAHIRGPLKAISTALPGVAFSEAFPKLAERADRLTVIRSLSHSAAPLHETGYQLLHTGRLSRGEERYPSFGSVIARQLGPRNNAPPYVVIPRLLGNTGINMYRGQTAGMLGEIFDPLTPNDAISNDNEATHRHPSISDKPGFRFPLSTDEPETVQRHYGRSGFGPLCLQARQLVEAGVRCVVVNLFDRLQEGLTWDCHGRTTTAPGTLFDYRDVLCPQFDQAVAALLDDLHERGLLDETLVVATGEFGRTPRINNNRGRDHWPGVWSGLLAGGGTPRGAVIGSSDKHAARPTDEPTSPAELVETIYRSLNVPSVESVSTHA